MIGTRRGRAAGALLVVALATALVGCSNDDDGQSPSAVTVTTQPRTDVGLMMLTEVPSGFLLQPDEAVDTGAVDLDRAVTDDPDPKARPALKEEGFVRGYQRLWLADGQEDQNLLQIYKFNDAAGATAHLTRFRELIDRKGTGSAVPFPVSGIPGAQGVTVSDSKIAGAIVDFSVGPYAVTAITNGPKGTDQAAIALSLAQAQFANIPATP